jgi:hypothetical protein
MVFPIEDGIASLRKAIDPSNPLAYKVRIFSDDIIPVSISSVDAGETDIAKFNSINSVNQATETLINSLLVQPSEEFYLSKIEVGGTNLAKFNVYINSTLVGIKRTWWTKFDSLFIFDDIKLIAGDLLEVKVIHNTVAVGDFEATIIGVNKI